MSFVLITQGLWHRFSCDGTRLILVHIFIPDSFSSTKHLYTFSMISRHNWWFSLALAYTVGFYSHEPTSLSHHNVLVDFNHNALIEIESHYANRSLFVSSTRSNT